MSWKHTIGIIGAFFLTAPLAGCVGAETDDSEYDEIDEIDEDLGEASDGIASAKYIYVKAHKGDNINILCRVPAEPVLYDSGQLKFSGKITCGTKMQKIEISKAATFYKLTSSGTPVQHHATIGFSGSNTDNKTYSDLSLCKAGSKTVYWGGAITWKLTWPSGWTVVPSSSYSSSGNVASGTLKGNYTAYNVGCK
ncbi:MAG: hypothetical protein R3B70_26435 [Polyangiaceae bacterium]